MIVESSISDPAFQMNILSFKVTSRRHEFSLNEKSADSTICPGDSPSRMEMFYGSRESWERGCRYLYNDSVLGPLCFVSLEKIANFLNVVFSCDVLYIPDILKKKNMLLSLWFAAFLGLAASVLGKIVKINALGDSITGSPVCFPFPLNFFTRIK